MRSLSLALSVFALTACSLAKPFVEPELSVVNFVLENATLFETTANVELRVDNENPYPLEIDGAVHRLYLNDTYLGKGFDKSGFRIPRLSSTKSKVTIHISNLSLLTKLHSLIESNKLSYRIESTLYPKGYSYRRVTASDSGSFDFMGLDRMATGTVRRYQPVRKEESKYRTEIDEHEAHKFFID